MCRLLYFLNNFLYKNGASVLKAIYSIYDGNLYVSLITELWPINLTVIRIKRYTAICLCTSIISELIYQK